jgi:hypothetical protein
MESLITSYGINFQAFQLTAISLDCLVAGSSALAGYLKQEGIEPGYTPNDLDIFVPGVLENVRDASGRRVAGQYVIKSLKTMKDFLAVYGFTENDKFGTIDAPTDGYYSSLTKIQKVTSFTNKDSQEIQVIVIDNYNLIDHISKDFDLSPCITWWDAHNNIFKTMDPDSTKRKEMYFVCVADTEEIHEKNKMRTEKYAARGFKLIDKPCPIIDARDPRDTISDKKFDDIEVTDIFTLDECPIRDYLQKSHWHIVIKAGEAYYGFHRKALMDYMNGKSVSVNRIGKFYETPFNQCITLEGYNKLRYSDYSIYELKNAYSVPSYGGRVKSLFHLNCYSLKQWIEGSEGSNVVVPPQSLTAPFENPLPVRRIIRRGEPLPPHNLAQEIEVSLDDILAAHAHLVVPGNLEAFHAAVREIHGEA